MNNKQLAILISIVLIALSFFKDLITPDYLNTPNAQFLSPVNRASGVDWIVSHKLFWFLSLVYSAAFVFFPWMIIRLLFGSEMAAYTLWILLALCLIEYAIILLNIDSLIRHLLPKINRYFHSPILLLFFIAAFTLNNRNNGSD